MLRRASRRYHGFACSTVCCISDSVSFIFIANLYRTSETIHRWSNRSYASIVIVGPQDTSTIMWHGGTQAKGLVRGREIAQMSSSRSATLNRMRLSCCTIRSRTAGAWLASGESICTPSSTWWLLIRSLPSLNRLRSCMSIRNLTKTPTKNDKTGKEKRPSMNRASLMWSSNV